MQITETKQGCFRASFWLFGHGFEKDFKTEKEALLFFENLRQSYITEIYTIEASIERYLQSVSRRKSKGSFKWDQFIFKRLLEHLQSQGLTKGDPVTKIKAGHLESFQVTLVYKKGLTPATANRYFSTLKNFFNKLCQWEMLVRSPAKHIKKLPENGRVKSVWREEDFAKFLKYINSSEDQRLLLFLNLTGARLSSAVDCRVTDVDLKRRVLTLRTKKGAQAQVKSYEFPIYDKLLKLLKTHIINRESLGISHDYLFFNKDGMPINSKNFAGRMKKALSRSGLRNNYRGVLSLHGLRHSMASRLHDGGLSVNEIKVLLGHSSVTVTEGYLHADAAAIQAKIEKIA